MGFNYALIKPNLITASLHAVLPKKVGFILRAEIPSAELRDVERTEVQALALKMQAVLSLRP